MSAHPQFRRKFGVACLGLIAATLPLAARASTIGLYTDEQGGSCSFSGNDPGIVSTYVMIRPDERGLHGVRFSAPIPSCLGAIFVEDIRPLGAEIIGDSQDGISVAFGVCATTPRVALQINYYRNSATDPCCAFPIAADPYVGMVEGVDCNHVSLTVDPVTSHFNADASCECSQPANLPPLMPSEPEPADDQLATPLWNLLRWQSTDPEHGPVTYDVYFGAQNPPVQVASELWVNTFDAGRLALQTRYYWRVVARDMLGRITEGPVWSFETRPNAAPYLPSTPSPKVGVSSQPLNFKLAWVCSDADLETLKYDVYLGASNSPPLVAENVATASFTVGPLDPATTYHWRIIARDPNGAETAGPTWSFATMAVSSFSASAGNEGIDVRWRLVSAEGMQSYTLYRAQSGSGPALAVAQGAVSGTTGSFFDDGVTPGVNYRYELSVLSDTGEDFRTSPASGNVVAKIPQSELGANHPNPFNPQTTIPYYLRVGGPVSLVIYDASGRVVRTLVNGRQMYGSYEVVWNGADDSGAIVSSGVYFALLKDPNGERRTRKLIMLK